MRMCSSWSVSRTISLVRNRISAATRAWRSYGVLSRKPIGTASTRRRTCARCIVSEVHPRKRVGSSVAQVPLVLQEFNVVDRIEVAAEGDRQSMLLRAGAEPPEAEGLRLLAGDVERRAVIRAEMRFRAPPGKQPPEEILSIDPSPASERRFDRGRAVFDLGAGPMPTPPTKSAWLARIEPREYVVGSRVCQMLFEPKEILLWVYPDLRWEWSTLIELEGLDSADAETQSAWKITGHAMAIYDGERLDVVDDLPAFVERRCDALTSFREMLVFLATQLRSQWTRSFRVAGPNLRLKYAAQLDEDEETAAVDSVWQLALEGSPFFQFSYSGDIIEVLLRRVAESGGPPAIRAILKAAHASRTKAMVAIETSASATTRRRASIRGRNGEATDTDGNLSLDVPFRLEGTTNALGSALVVRYRAAAPGGGAVGITGAGELGADAEGIHLTTGWAFSGVVVQDLEYEKFGFTQKRNKSKEPGEAEEAGLTWVAAWPDNPDDAKAPKPLIR